MKVYKKGILKLKQERGVTLTSLVIYIIGLLVVMGLITTYSGYFFGKTDDVISKNSAEEQYTRFLAYITKDINSENITVGTSANELSLTLSNGEKHDYVFENGKIFYRKSGGTENKIITLCSDVEADTNIFTFDGSKIMFHFYINGVEFINTFYTNI